MDEQPESDLPELSLPSLLPFPVVGIGASAGGLTALIRLLENMQPDPGMALVVVLHLARDMPSAADRVLQRATDMPVIQVTNRIALRPNQVYVISPGRSLRMEDSHLIVEEPLGTLGMPMTINIFLRTLAEAHGERAIGVLLSGMGSDGVAGLACIKEHGGVAVAQLPGDAEERSMPQAAIDSGMVDFVLPAAQIPARLVEMRDVMQAIHQEALEGHAPPPELPPFDMGEHTQELLEEVLSLVYAHTGHDFRHYKQATILRRIERRMQLRVVPDLPAYHRLLQQDLHEPDALVQELLIGVTNFFRDRDAFDVLEQFILPRIFHERKAGAPLRAWVTACSTGEEAYSLAMLLAERTECIDGTPAMQIFATDIDERAIAVARAGRYPDAISADVRPERLARHFKLEDSHFRVRKLLRDHILFARHDLLHDPAFSRLDLITCRNVLIYLNREVHRHLLEVFHAALNPGGYLFLGSAESADLAPDLFAPVNRRHRIYQAKPSAHTGRRLSIALPAREIVRPAAAPGLAVVVRSDIAPPGYQELHQRTLAQIVPSVLVDGKGDIVHVSDSAGAFLHLGGGEPSTQLLALAPLDVRADLRAALFQAQESDEPVHTGPIRYRQDGVERVVAIGVLPVPGGAEGIRLVRFDAIDAASSSAAPGEPVDPRVRELEDSLECARRNMRQMTRQADAANAALAQANQRLQASVEELRADVEEFVVAREEMQSRNEELCTVNAELQVRADETAQANDDLTNLIASTDIATLFLDRHLRIQRYTPSVTRIFNVIPADVGRPLTDLTGKLDTKLLLHEVDGVFASGQPAEREARSSNGRDYIVRVHPYRTAYERIEGAVLTFFDISSSRQAEKALRESDQRLATAFAALPLGIGIIDPDGTTIMLNEVMRRFMPTGMMPSRDAARVVRWRGWDEAGAPVAPEDFPGSRALRGESVMSGMQMLHTDDDGRETWTEVRSAPLLDGEGSITGALAVVIDVDRLKRSEEAARQSAQRQAFLLRLADAVRPLDAAADIQGEATRLLREQLAAGWCYYVEWDEAAALGVVLRDAAREGLASLVGTHDVSEVPEFLDIIRERTMLNVGDYANYDGLSQRLRARYTALGFRSMLVATLVKQGRLVASLIVGGTEVCDWSGDAQALLMEVAERTWAASERSRAQAAAARAERRAESILERMSEAHCVLGPDYRFLGVNAAAELLLGKERATLLGRSHWDAFPGSLDGPVGQAFRRVVEEGAEQHFTHHYADDGGDVHLEVDAYPTDEGGVAVFWRDVTEKLRAAQALQTSEEKYRALFNEMDEAYAVVEVMADGKGNWNDFRFLDANPAFMRHTGMPYPVGRTATELLGAPNPRWAQLYGGVVETGQPLRVEEGELTLGRVFDLNIFRLGGDDSHRVAVLFTDITGRKRDEEALRASELRLAEELAKTELLQRLSTSLMSKRRPEAMHDDILEAAMMLAGSDAASFQFLDPATGRLRLIASRNLHPASAEFWRDMDGGHASTCGRAMRTHGRVVVEDTEADPEMAGSADLEEYRRSGIRAVQSTPLRAGSGRVVGLISTHWHAPRALTEHDFTLFDVLARQLADLVERAQTEEVLYRSEERYRMLFDASPMPFVVTGPNAPHFTVVGVNEAFLRATMRTREALVGHHLFEEFPDDPDIGISSVLRASFERVLATRRQDMMPVMKYDIPQADGTFEERWWIPLQSPVLDDDGQVKAIIHSATDVTDIHRAGAALRASEEQQAYLLGLSDALRSESDADAVAHRTIQSLLEHLRLDRCYIAVYRMADDRADFTHQVAIDGLPRLPDGIRLSDFPEALQIASERTLVIDNVAHTEGLSPTDRRNIQGLGMAALVAATLRRGEDFPVWVIVAVSATPRRWTQGEIALLEEVTERAWGAMERARAEQQLRDADRRKDEFLATLAHELRNPLAPISNALQFLRHPDGKRVADRLLAMVERQVRQLVRMVDDLMEVTRVSRGKVDLRRAEVALAEVLNNAVESSLSAFEQKHHGLTVDIPDETFMLDADKVRLIQVFANLLNNAAKYTAPGGQAWLTARRDGQHVRITVRDTGMGIDKEQLPLIFDMFSQPHGRKGHSDSGLGIGLAMVRSLVGLHGGTVQAHSEGLGQGSEFAVRLPLHDCPDAALRKVDQPVKQNATPLAGCRILVVDDNRDAADTLCELLVMRGADASAVYGGRTALDSLDSAIPDAIVLDIGMPDMDGYEVANRIRQDERAKGVLLVALSGWGQYADRQRSRECGFDHHLTKPVELDSLLNILTA